VINAAAANADRAIDPEHFGAMVLFARNDIPDAVKARLAALRPDGDADELVAVGADALRDRLARYAAVDFSKLVVVPLGEPTPEEGGWDAALAALADAVLDLQT
jgi:hypothetical protein